MIRVGILQPPDAMRSSVALTWDALEAANRLARQDTGRETFEIRDIQEKAERVPLCDLVILPSLAAASEAEIDQAMADPRMRRLRDRLQEAAADGADLATSCSGVFVLASAGLLHGRRVAASWWLAPLLRRRHPSLGVTDQARVVIDGPILTGGAGVAHLDLMLALIERHGGVALAETCARHLAGRPPGPAAPISLVGDPVIAQAKAWIRERLDGPIGVDEVAAAVGLSSRTFARRTERDLGLSPIRLIQRLRLDAAVALLQTTRLPVEEVARLVGYQEASTLRRIMQRDLARAPGELRAA